ncbi:LacI family DNA-binding transcriptional regulator [Microbacterium sp. ARD32]|uniref:LacI family DNA-binding transcriptional regulator n=1 Tax=Microbacterium sp. ARD32 TaxID=2962577 RepID=UPI0028810424|nr:LacI family DNA-binding transcriptional regulator [Microbacterium sp. ARD32]MDT0158177.1 LacI family DNA-binding transcriptional regulator [Microbacterium sp. ARD32]
MNGKKSATQRVTIREMADRLGVSVASVSYALNGRPGVGDATRERVLALAEELGWHPSSSARALSRSRTDTIGMVLRRDPELLGQEPYYMSLLSGVESVLSEARQSLMLRMVGTQPGRDLDVYRQWSAERRVDGVIVLDRLIDDPRPHLLRSLGMPFVMHGLRVEPETGRQVVEDLVTDAHVLVDHLAALGHTDIIDLTGPLALAHEVERRRAIADRAAVHRMRVTVAEGDYTLDAAERLVSHRLADWGPATAVISSNDVMALGVIRALRAAARTDVALVSWDDSMLCELSVPSITSLARRTGEQGRRSARTLLRTIAGEEQPSEDAIPSELIVRETSIPRR